MKGSRLKIRAVFVMLMLFVSILAATSVVMAENITIAGCNIPSSDIQSGVPSNLYDGSLSTVLQFIDGNPTTCLVSFHWNSLKVLDAFQIYSQSGFQDPMSHIYSLWYITSPYDPGDPYHYDYAVYTNQHHHLVENTYSDILYGNTITCYGIVIGVYLHGDYWTHPIWNEVRAIADDPPNTPSNPSPTNGATGVSVTADLSWSGGDPNSGDTVTYDVYFGTSSSPPKVVSNQSATSYDPGTMSYNTMYYWKIVAWDNHGLSNIGSIWHFTTEVQIQPQLSYSPTTINFGTHDQGWTGSGTFEIWNSGTGTLTYTISESLSWITSVNPSSGSSTGEHDTITVYVGNTGSMSGYYSGYIDISSNGGSGSVFVDITINTPVNPVLSYSPTTINFGTHDQGWTGSSTFEIWNSGAGTLSYTLSESINWISISPSSGSSTGEHDTITVSVSNTGSMSGYYSGSISISSNGGSGSVFVDITINAPSNPALSYSPTEIHFGTHNAGWTGSSTFEIWNSGAGTLSYTLSESLSWISVSPSSGSSTGEHDTITVTAANTGGMHGYNSGTISITSNGGSGSVFVDITISNNPPNVPGNPTPSNSSVGVPVVATLHWSGGDNDNDDVTYTVYINGCPEPDYSDYFPLYNTTVTTMQYTVALVADQTYYWKVVATDEHGAKSYGPTWTFSTKTVDQVPPTENTPPNRPTQIVIAPSNPYNIYHVHDFLILSTTVSDPDGDNMHIFWDFDADDDAIDFQLMNKTSSAYAIPCIWDKPEGTYNIRVAAIDMFGGASLWSINKTITIVEAEDNVGPTNASAPAGDDVVYKDLPCKFTTVAYDPDPEDEISYQWDFNGEQTDWVGGFDSGELCEYSWTFDYTTEESGVPVKVRARDTDGNTSYWSAPAYVKVIKKKTSTIFNRNDFCGFTHGDIFNLLVGAGRVMYANGTTGAIVTGSYAGFPYGLAGSTACQGVKFHLGRSKTITVDAEISYTGHINSLAYANLKKVIKVDDPYKPEQQYIQTIDDNLPSVEDLQLISNAAIGLAAKNSKGGLLWDLVKNQLWVDNALEDFAYIEEFESKQLDVTGVSRIGSANKYYMQTKYQEMMKWGAYNLERDSLNDYSFVASKIVTEGGGTIMFRSTLEGINTAFVIMTAWDLGQKWGVDNMMREFENSGKATRIHVTRTFTLDEGDHDVWAGLQSEAYGALTFMGFSYAAGLVRTITIDGISEPEVPTMRWPEEVRVLRPIAFEACGVDQNGDPLQYFIDWGDGTTTTTAPSAQNTWVSVPHTYSSVKTYVVTIKSIDCDGMESPVNTYTLYVPLSRQSSHQTPFLNFLENHPDMFPLLQKLLQRLKQ